MQTFKYVVKDEVGIHARPAGLLVNFLGGFSSQVTITKGEKSADAKRLLAVLTLGVKCGQEVTVTVEGQDEENAAAQIEQFFKDNL